MGNKTRRTQRLKKGFQRCPTCQTQVPEGLVICWFCGTCLNPHIEKLAETKNK